jgi:biotin carboxyl carrier protein
VVLDDQKTSIRTAFINNRRIEFGWTRNEEGYLILIDGIEYQVEVRNARAEMAAKYQRVGAAETGETIIKAPIPGLVRKIHVKVGDVVTKDQTLLTLDAMKLENEIPAPRAGTVKSISVQPGMPVDKGQVLAVVG